MKLRSLTKFSSIIFVLAGTFHQANAESVIWNGTTDDQWSTSTNWSADTVPSSGDTAVFNSTGGATIVDLGTGVTIGSIAFDTSAVAAYTLGTGGAGTQTLTLADSGSITANSTINNNQIFNANLTLGTDGSAQSYALTNSDNTSLINFEGTITGGTGGTPGAKTINVNTSSTGGFIMKGVVSNGGASSLGIVKTGTGQLNLGNPSVAVAHTFSGGVAVEEGIFTISGGGSANNSTISLGAAGNTGSIARIAVVNSGTNPASPLTVVDQTSGTATTRILGTNSSTSGQWSGPITMNDDLTVTTATAGGFTLQSGATVNLNSNTLTLSAATNTPTAAANVLVRGKITGAGNVAVNNTGTAGGIAIIEGTTHDYTGTTNVTAGTLQIGGGSAGAINSSTILLGASGNSGTSARLGVAHASTNPTSPLTVVDQTSGTATTRILGTSGTTTGQWNGPITMNDDLTVTTAAATFTLNTGASVNLNANTLTLSNTSATSAANLLAKGLISGTGNLVVSNTSTGSTVGLLALEADNDFTGTTTISAGTLLVGNGGATGSIASTSGILNSGILDYKRTGSLNQGGPISGNGSVRVTAGGTVTFDKANTYSGTTTFGGGGKIIVATGGSIAPTTGNSITLGSSGNGTLQYDSEATSKFAVMNIGTGGTSASGTLNQTNGVINGTSMILGGGNSGSYGGIVAIGNASGTAAALNISGDVSIGASGAYTSTLTVNSTGSLSIGGTLRFATSTNRSASGVLTQSGGTVSAAALNLSANLSDPTGRTHTSVYNLDGGTLTTGPITVGAISGTPTSGTHSISATFNFNGGTLKPTASSANFWNANTVVTANVKDGGARIDTAGFNITISQPLVKFAGSTTDTLTKDGLGTLTLGGTNTYSGNTTVSAGTLSLSQVNSSNESSTVSIASGAILNLGFAGIDTVDKLFINGVQQAAGDYTSAHASGRFTGGGTLRVTTGSVASGFASWIDDFGLAVADQDSTDDPDNDGVENMLEYVLNGNPGSSDPTILPALDVSGSNFIFTFTRREDSATDTTQVFQYGSNLSSWTSLNITSPTASGVTLGTTADGAQPVTVSIPKSLAGPDGKLFGRLQVIKNP